MCAAARSRSASRAEASLPRELALDLTRAGSGPLRHKLTDALRAAIRDGRLRAGDRLPSTRALAAQLGISRGVTSYAYEELAVGGYIELRDRASPRVSGTTVAQAPPTEQLPGSGSGPRYSFAVLSGDLSLFPRSDWLRCAQAVLRAIPDAELDYVDPAGHHLLRAELAEHLRRARGVSVDAGRVLIAQGNTQALEIVFRVLAARGARRLALENPSFDAAWSAARRAGLQTLPLPVDEQGARPDDLDLLAPDALLLTPAHQFPLGSVLSAQRRAQFVQWASEHDRFVIEDDYDGEFYYEREPAPGMQGLDPERVIYVGTASKILAPALRLGWLGLPLALVSACAEAKLSTDRGSPTLDQLVLAELLRRGLLDRHLRRVRDAYRERRDVLVAGLRDRLPEAHILGRSAGTHVTVLLPAIDDEQALRREATKRALALRTLGEFAFAPNAHGAGIVAGYGRLNVAALAPAIDLLADAVHAAERG